MGIVVRLQDENGERLDEIADIHNILHRILPAEDDPSYPCLRYVDWYGDTVFNRTQARDVLRELELILSRSSGRDEQELLSRIIQMVKRCLEEVHLYLKFIGD